MSSLLLVWVAAAVPTADAGVEPFFANSRLSKERVRLGEPFLYEIDLVHRPDQRFELHPPSNLGPFEILEQSRRRVDGPTQSTTSIQMTVALYELGVQKIPDLAFDGTGPAGSTRHSVPGPTVEGVSAFPEDAGQAAAALRDIRPPEEIPIRTYRLLWALLWASVLAVVAYGLYRWSQRPPRVEVRPTAPVGPLDVRTFAALDELRSQDLAGQGRFKEFYFRLSEILRAYLGERYGFEALECTRTELLENLSQRSTPGLPAEELTRFVNRADLVKFAKASADASECQESLELGYRIVRQTRSAPMDGGHAVVDVS